MGERSNYIELATRNFAKPGEATAFFKGLLNRYRPGERINNNDALDVAALLERHSEYLSKVGCGVSHFEVMMTKYGTKCFRVIRTDDSGTDFSYLHCITQCPPARKQAVLQALRQVVRFDLYKARDAFFAAHGDADGNVLCAATGKRITQNDVYMDYRPPMTFEVIVTTFFCSRGISLDSVALTTGHDDQVCPKVTDLKLSEAFRSYHMSMARLFLIRSTINLI